MNQKQAFDIDFTRPANAPRLPPEKDLAPYHTNVIVFANDFQSAADAAKKYAANSPDFAGLEIGSIRIIQHAVIA